MKKGILFIILTSVLFISNVFAINEIEIYVNDHEMGLKENINYVKVELKDEKGEIYTYTLNKSNNYKFNVLGTSVSGKLTVISINSDKINDYNFVSYKGEMENNQLIEISVYEKSVVLMKDVGYTDSNGIYHENKSDDKELTTTTTVSSTYNDKKEVKKEYIYLVPIAIGALFGLFIIFALIKIAIANKN